MSHNRELAASLAARIGAEQKECFRNGVLGMMAVGGECHYMEGLLYLARFGLYIEHGWLLVDGQIVDPTLDDVDAEHYVPVFSYDHGDVRRLVKEGRTLPFFDKEPEKRRWMSALTSRLYEMKMGQEEKA